MAEEKTILVVEDDKDISSLLKYRLEAHGYKVVCAGDGVKALDMAKKLKPNLITLDLNLPELNGFTVCSMLKADPKYSEIPIIMLTARDGYADKVFDESSRPEAYITKPFEVDDLLEAIRKHII